MWSILRRAAPFPVGIVAGYGLNKINQERTPPRHQIGFLEPDLLAFKIQARGSAGKTNGEGRNSDDVSFSPGLGTESADQNMPISKPAIVIDPPANPPFSTGNLVFAFGPSERFFLAMQQSDLSWSSKARLTSGGTLNKMKRHEKLHFFAMTHSGDEVCGWNDKITGDAKLEFWFHPDRPESASKYVTLQRWLAEHVQTDEQMADARIVFGTGSSYFATSCGKAIWHDLPRELDERLQAAKSKHTEEIPHSTAWIPRILALGAQDQFIAIWKDDTASISLREDVTLLRRFIGSGQTSIDLWENIVLSPFVHTDWIHMCKNGYQGWSLHNMKREDIIDVMAHSAVYKQYSAKKDYRTWDEEWTLSGKLIKLKITPETNWTSENVEAAIEEQTALTVADKVVASYKKGMGSLASWLGIGRG
jgi:hypothetical protein